MLRYMKQSNSCQTFEIKLLAGKLEETLKNCSVFHQFISKKFSSHKEISLETLEGLRTQLIEEKANVIKAYEQLREACGDLEPDLKIRNQIDRVGADNENCLQQVLGLMHVFTSSKTALSNQPGTSSAASLSKPRNPAGSTKYPITNPQLYQAPADSTPYPTRNPVNVIPPWNISSVSDQQAFANTLAQAIHTIKLKPAEPTVFFGEPLEYLDWKVAFEGLIESGSYNPLQKIALLQQYLGGKAKRVVANLFQIGTEEAFKEAKRKLNDKFGKPHILTEAYRTQLEQWPLIKEHDGEALDELVNFLESCQTAMNKLPELNCLNDRRENEKILAKLPISVGNRWVKIATEIESTTDRFPAIFDFVRFLSKEADVASNSLNKAIAKRVVSNRNHDNSYKRNQPIRKPEKQATAFLISENQATTANISYDVTKPMRRYPCLMCNMDNHSTGICFKLEKLPHSDIERFFDNNNLCYSCAKPGHKMDKCRHPAICTKKDCEQKHLAVFHKYYNGGSENKTSQPNKKSHNNQIRGSENKSSTQNSTSTRGSENKTSQPNNHNNSNSNQGNENKPTQATARNCAGNRPANLTSWTIPVYVSSIENPGHEVLVYALLDSGSNHTFITHDTIHALNATTHDTDMNISTLTDVQGSTSSRQTATGLLVRGYNKQKYIELPTCVSQAQIPFNRNEIPDSMSVQDWPHLRHLASEFITAREGNQLTLGLLIGGNLPQVFMSRQEITAGDNVPFARLSDLGWLLMGNTTKNSTHKNPRNLLAIVNLAVLQPTTRENISFKYMQTATMKMPTWKPKSLKILSFVFDSDPSNENSKMSIDDINFLKLMKEQTYKDIEGHITMPLPLKLQPGPNKSRYMALNQSTL
ncbi:hypothetical protein EB796_006104 [Bugula neritina]|uniref:CCHC-type domain-containing protein n=1 Tax=Bugula neritina TaxID=10212 RepID=A0A7J7KBD3_BUGNE|nr:hypothetical protein EB796_006104 [Bugula neritina]